jgi:hypothetical protein
LGEGAVAAKMAIQAWNMMVQRDAVAHFESLLRAPCSEFHNRPGGFVSENARRLDGAVLDFFDVGRADAADGDFDEQFIRVDARDGHGLDAQVVHTAIDDGAHGFGDVEHGGDLTTDDTDGHGFFIREFLRRSGGNPPFEFSFAGGLHLLKNLVRKIFRPILGLWFCGLLVAARADSFQLADGSSVSGDIVTFNDNGLMLRMADDSYTNFLWMDFSRDALVQLEKNPKLKPLVEPFIESPTPQRPPKPKITIQGVPRLELPPKQSIFLSFFYSSTGFIILLLIYVANLYAAYEIAALRAHSLGLVMSAAVVLPILGPIIFLSMPMGGEIAEPAIVHPAVKAETFALPGAADEFHIVESSWQKEAADQEPQIFQRGQFMFNRRFFETKFANFFGSFRREAEKDLVLIVKTAYAQIIVQRITRITTNEMHLEILQGTSRREIIMPFADIQEVQIRHKDA